MQKPLTIRLLHWFVALLFLLAIPTGYRLADTGWSGVGLINRSTIHASHQTSGILIACLMVIWAIYRIWKSFQTSKSTSIYQKLVAVSHILLAVLGALIAFTGWMGSSAGNYGQELFGVIPIPNIIPVFSAKEAVSLYAFHKSLISYFLFFLSLHIIAVLFYTIILKDQIIKTIWFSKSKTSHLDK